MEQLIKQYEDYYLIKCYSQKNYRSDFNAGKLYFKELSYFHNVENEFQQDQEGMIFQQAKNSIGTWYAIDPISSATVSDLMKKGNVTEGIRFLEATGNRIANSIDLNMRITGFISCFYLMPKCNLKISQKNIDISPVEEYVNFIHFLNSYAKKQGYTYISIYKASQLIEKLYHTFNAQDYSFSFGCVNYEDVDTEKRIKWFLDKQIQKIVFTKPHIFKFQREFRFFVSPKEQIADDSICITSDGLEDVIVSSLAYLTPEYYKRLKEG